LILFYFNNIIGYPFHLNELKREIMGVYSVMLSDDHLIKSLQNFNQIVILGCGGCANDSLAYDNDIPLLANFDPLKEQYRPEPDAILTEAKRLKTLLENYNKTVLISIGMHLCSTCTGDKLEEWINICRNTEAVLTLSCVAGTIGVKIPLKKTVKVIPGMKTLGVLYCHNIFDPVKGMINIDKKKSIFVATFNK
jgi:hypothetical protein